jgi:hypothetical protein
MASFGDLIAASESYAAGLFLQRGFDDITRSNSKYLNWICGAASIIMKTFWQIL